MESPPPPIHVPELSESENKLRRNGIVLEYPESTPKRVALAAQLKVLLKRSGFSPKFLASLVKVPKWLPYHATFPVELIIAITECRVANATHADWVISQVKEIDDAFRSRAQEIVAYLVCVFLLSTFSHFFAACFAVWTGILIIVYGDLRNNLLLIIVGSSILGIAVFVFLHLIGIFPGLG